MGETGLVLIDGEKKRIDITGWMSLDGILASLADDPDTIDKFDQAHQENTGTRFYQDEIYESYKPDETTDYDLPIRNQAEMDSNFSDGVMVVDLRTKTIDYYFTTGDKVQRKKSIDPSELARSKTDCGYQKYNYELSSDWTITEWKSLTEK